MKHQTFSQRNKCVSRQLSQHLVPLVSIPESNVNIYSDCICIGSDSQQTIDSINLSNSIKDLQQPTNNNGDKFIMQQPKGKKSISFTKIKLNSPDLAFNIKDEQKVIEIFDIIRNSLIFKFSVNKNETLLIVKSLLRRKLCQLGFQRAYKFIKFLGKGATASVHLVERISDKKLFAAKIISIKDADDKSYETFINESKLLRILKHKNIINLQSLYVHKKELIQVMQYLNGGTLYQSIVNNQVSFKQKWRIIRDITNGLEYLRQRSIVHRDIKTQNILIRKVGDRHQYVISDFGLASWIGEAKPLFEKCGTPGYIAPEILNAPKNTFVLNHKTDIFSLGVIAHLLFMGQPLFCTEDSKYDIKEVLRLNKQAEYNLDDDYYDLPILEKSFLEMTLEKDSQKRATAYDLLVEISFADRDAYQTPDKLKSKGNNSKLVDSIKRNWKVEVEYSQKPKLKKHKVSLSLGCKEGQKYEKRQKNKDRVDYKQQNRKASSARKFLTGIWDSITKPSPRKQSLKIKDNSIEKQRRLSQYFY